MFKIQLIKGKRLKSISCAGRLLTEVTIFPNNVSAELQYKILKDKRKHKGWSTKYPNPLIVCSKIEHTRSRRRKATKLLGRIFRDGTIGDER